MPLSLMDELRADQNAQRCKLCVWIESRPPAEQKEWDLASGDKSYSNRSIHRALERREAGIGRASVENHRAGGHRS